MSYVNRPTGEVINEPVAVAPVVDYHDASVGDRLFLVY